MLLDHDRQAKKTELVLLPLISIKHSLKKRKRKKKKSINQATTPSLAAKVKNVLNEINT